METVNGNDLEIDWQESVNILQNKIENRQGMLETLA